MGRDTDVVQKDGQRTVAARDLEGKSHGLHPVERQLARAPLSSKDTLKSRTRPTGKKINQICSLANMAHEPVHLAVGPDACPYMLHTLFPGCRFCDIEK